MTPEDIINNKKNKESRESKESKTRKGVSKSYQLPPSLLAHLPWVEFDDEQGCVLLQDTTVGVVFELSLVASEAKLEVYLQQLRDNFQGIFQDTFPAYRNEESPWIIQCYVQDELSMNYLYQMIDDYIQPTAQECHFKEDYLKLMKEHCDWLSRSEGVFFDDKVTDSRFHGGRRKVILTCYRQANQKFTLTPGKSGKTAIQDLQQVTERLMSKLKGIGVQAKRLVGQEFREWLIRWFNPKPTITEGNIENLIALTSNPAHSTPSEERPFGYDFAEQLFYAAPVSNEQEGVWYFDGLPHRYISIQQLTKVPEIGQLTRERAFGNFQYSLFDKFPEGSVFVLTVVIQSQEMIKQHLDRIEQGARKSPTTAATVTFADCQVAKTAIEKGNYLLPASMGVYVRGENLEELAQKELTVEALLINHGFHVLKSEHDLVPLQSYLHHLPFCYHYQFDKKYLYRSSYVFAKQLANLLPLYGRERGTGHPLMQFLNRGGESFTLDPFNPEDKDHNSHLLLLGSTGSGKSATSTDLLIKLMGTYRPYLVIVDAGHSFHLLKDYFVEQGFLVNRVEVTLENPPILNPFAESQAMLKQLEKMNITGFYPVEKNQTVKLSEQALATLESRLEQDEEALSISTNNEAIKTIETLARDYLGEMALSAQLMITGGERKEQANLSRQDRMLILDALIRAAYQARNGGFTQMIPEDVVVALRETALLLEHTGKEVEKQLRLRAMADSMAFFTKDTLAHLVFNRRSEPWPEADITLFEQGIFKDEGYEAHNALAFMGLMSRTMAKAQSRQFEERFTVFFGDEIHTITKNSLTVVYLTKCAKMSRKFGLWLWLATQNVSDFPKEARKILSMIEFWICLGMSEAEMKSIEEFRKLSEEERNLFRSVRKASKKYVEGVLLCPKVKALFRNVPPRLSLALAMTEKHEKAERRKLMDQYQVSELEAAKMIAQALQR